MSVGGRHMCAFAEDFRVAHEGASPRRVLARTCFQGTVCRLQGQNVGVRLEGPLCQTINV